MPQERHRGNFAICSRCVDGARLYTRLDIIHTCGLERTSFRQGCLHGARNAIPSIVLYVSAHDGSAGASMMRCALLGPFHAGHGHFVQALGFLCRYVLAVLVLARYIPRSQNKVQIVYCANGNPERRHVAHVCSEIDEPSKQLT